ncbi:MAG: hypothetical protein EZS28_036828 [Streblomastix strix]|uniref:Uncharacterized protein n=1 Tax=Streblomastix strix TaxID=222440 RepID=A0A5J4UBQ3_9EUKA|nr:MAG: hypothetical protein EZS28_036828 [Streblomastix strix]
MWTYARAQFPFVFDQPTTSKVEIISQKDHTSQYYQMSVLDWLDSLVFNPKYTNAYLKQSLVQSHSQQNKQFNNQRQKVKTKNNQRENQKESQLMEQMIMESVTNLSTQSNPSTSQTETMDSEGMNAGRSYRPLSTEKRTPRSISQKIPPALQFTKQIDHIDSKETVVERSYRQTPMKMDIQTIKQSITLAMKTITSKRMIIEPEKNKTTKDPIMKTNMNKKPYFKIMEMLKQEKQDHLIQHILNKNQEIQQFYNPKANLLYSSHLQNQAKLK